MEPAYVRMPSGRRRARSTSIRLWTSAWSPTTRELAVRRSGIAQDGHRAVTHQAHARVRPEPAGGGLDPALTDRRDHLVDERLRHGPRGGTAPGQTAPLAHVRVQGELGDHQDTRARIEHGALAGED